MLFEDPSNACDRDNVVTLFDVARLAGVSTATVSRVVHGQDRVREATRIRVQQAIEELGYVPDGAAQSLSRRRKDVIGLVCVERQEQQYDIENMNLLFYDEVLRGVEARIRDQEWSLLITFLQGANDPSYARIESFTGKVDGILIGEGIVPSPFIERLATRVPVVIFAGTPHEQAVDVVTADNLSGSAAVVTHLIRDHGKRSADGLLRKPDSTELVEMVGVRSMREVEPSGVHPSPGELVDATVFRGRAERADDLCAPVLPNGRARLDARPCAGQAEQRVGCGCHHAHLTSAVVIRRSFGRQPFARAGAVPQSRP